MKLAQGTVIGLIAGYYDVETAAGIVRTRARGVFRQKKQKPAVGDRVEIQIDDKGMSYLVKIMPRLNRIGRPAVANVFVAQYRSSISSTISRSEPFVFLLNEHDLLNISPPPYATSLIGPASDISISLLA